MQKTIDVAARLREQAAGGKMAILFLRSRVEGGKRASSAYWRRDLGLGDGAFVLELKAEDAIRPYYPFMEIIRARYLALDQAQRDDVFDRAYIHKFHAHILRTWLDSGASQRDDDIYRPPAEFDFERGCFFADLASLMQELWRDSELAIVLENFERAGMPLARFVLYLVENRPVGSIRLICAMDELPQSSPRWKTEFRYLFFSRLERRAALLPFAVDIPPMDPSDAERLKGARWEKRPPLIEMLAMSRCFMAYEELRGFPEPLDFPKPDIGRAAYHQGVLLLMSHEVNEALIRLNQALEKIRQSNDVAMMVRISVMIAICYSKRGEFDEAERHFRMGEKMAHESSHEQLKSFLDFLRFLVLEKYAADAKHRAELEEVERRVEEQGMDELLLHIRSNVSYYEGLLSASGWEAAIARAREALAVAESTGSLYKASKLHHALAYLCQMRGLNDEAIEHFERCIEFRTELGAKDELIRAYNGVGYLCFCIGRFDASLAYFGKSLELVEPQKAYAETCLTLFNIVNIYFFSGNFVCAQQLIESVLMVLDYLGLPSLPFHSRKKLLCFAGASAYYCGQRTLALDFWKEAQPLPDDIEAGPNIHLLRSLRAWSNRDEKAAKESLRAAIGKSIEAHQPYFHTFLLMEGALRLLEEGRESEAREGFKTARRVIEQDGNKPQLRLLDHLEAGGDWMSYMPEAELDSRIKMITLLLRDTARQEATNQNLLKKLNEISFLKSFHETITRDLEEKVLFSHTLTMLRRNFLFSSVFFLEDKLSPRIAYGYPRRTKVDRVWHWDKLFPGEKTAPPMTRINQEGWFLAYPFRFRQEKGLWAVLSIREGDPGMGKEELEIVNLALRHLDLTLDLHQAKEALKQAVARDPPHRRPFAPGVPAAGRARAAAQSALSQGSQQRFCHPLHGPG